MATRVARLAFVLIILVAMSAAPRAYAVCGATPSVTATFNPPDNLGQASFRIDYSFPDTVSQSQRLVGIRMRACAAYCGEISI